MLPSRAARIPAVLRGPSAPVHASRVHAPTRMQGRHYYVNPSESKCDWCKADRANLRTIANERLKQPIATEIKAHTVALKENTKELKALRNELKIHFEQNPTRVSIARVPHPKSTPSADAESPHNVQWSELMMLTIPQVGC